MSALADELEIYNSIDEVPLDNYPHELEGNNSLLAEAPWANPDAKPLSSKAESDLLQKMLIANMGRLGAVKPHAPRKIVPHPRDLHRLMVGPDVQALHRALSVAGACDWAAFTMVFGPGLLKALKRFQQTHGLHVDGVYGAATHRKLAQFYDAWGIHLINQVHVKTPADVRLGKLKTAVMTTYNRGSIMHYTQGPLRMFIVRNRISLKQLATMHIDYEDCSSGTTGLRYVAGLSDPNEFGFNGYGFTGTQSVHGVRVSGGSVRFGDLYFYGRFPFYHVTMNIGQNRAWSQGGEYGPTFVDPYYGPVGDIRRYPGLP